jgi:serine/threonine protein kinase
MNFANLIGQTIDGKYKVERLLGKGGMGAVYLATHLGTERPVAVKVIVPQFMERAEFVERFRREARAAGRLRHPNVVDVTDFGIADMPSGKVAYLVMEYLDGCTLGEILEEEKKLPLLWSLDILEQVCSAVHAAHEQGIIHRDLKPDNIWLEPNQRGSYTVKVLDFGIAKLETPHGSESAEGDIHISVLPTNILFPTETRADSAQTHTFAESSGNSTMISEKATAILTAEAGKPANAETEFSENSTAILDSNEVDLEAGTAIFADKKTQIIQKEDGTRHIAAPSETDKNLKISSTAELTRVGAVLGTPLYMSPEQCRGEKLTARSDIYSLAIIAYQMLGGKTPFEGDFTSVMEAHKSEPPPPLTAKKIPRKIKKVVNDALSKNPDERPQTAEGFASRLRAQSEGITTLLRRSMVIYTEHLPKFLGLTVIFLLPVIFLTFALIALSFLRLSEVIEKTWADVLIGLASTLMYVLATYCASLIVGATTWIVAQHFAVPLRPVRVRPALKAVKRKWKTFAWTAVVHFIFTHLALLACGVGFLVATVIWSLSSSVVMMESLSGWKALKRSFELVKRSVWTTIAALCLMFILPAAISGTIAFFVGVTTYAIENKAKQVAVSQSDSPNDSDNSGKAENSQEKKGGGKLNFGFGSGQKFNINNEGKDMRSRAIETVQGSLIQIFWLPMQLFDVSFTSIILALLYLKTRQAGGESMRDLLEQFEEAEERPKTKWQQRVQERLIQSGRITTGKTQKNE